jgi:hypothetical protein
MNTCPLAPEAGARYGNGELLTSAARHGDRHRGDALYQR